MNKKRKNKHKTKVTPAQQHIIDAFQRRNSEMLTRTRNEALELFQSPRGRYIVGQALYIACEKLKNSEPSNASHMRFLGEKLFGIGWHIESTKKVIPSLMRKAVANAK